MRHPVSVVTLTFVRWPTGTTRPSGLRSQASHSPRGADLELRPLLILAMTGSVAQFGVVSLIRAIPWLLLAPVGGVVADRFESANRTHSGQRTGLRECSDTLRFDPH